ncbi:MAG: polymer-forming cytoskeletal protein [Candidatus Binatus sp.]
MLLKRNLTFLAIRLNFGKAASLLTKLLPATKVGKGEKRLHQNEANGISSAPQVVKLNGTTKPSPGARRDSRLPKGSEIIGTLFFEGPVVIDGHVEGEITGQDEITLGENGSITSDELRAPSVIIAGTVKVKTIASPRVEILPTGKVWGDIASTVLNIHEGAHFEGSAFAPKAK